MLLARYVAALALTLAVELPLYAGLLGIGWRVGWRRAVALAAAVNLLTHPFLWWSLRAVATRPGYPWILLGAEVAVCAVEWLLLRAWLRRQDPMLLAVSVAANAASVLAGLLASGFIGAVA